MGYVLRFKEVGEQVDEEGRDEHVVRKIDGHFEVLRVTAYKGRPLDTGSGYLQ